MKKVYITIILGILLVSALHISFPVSANPTDDWKMGENIALNRSASGYNLVVNYDNPRLVNDGNKYTKASIGKCPSPEGWIRIDLDKESFIYKIVVTVESTTFNGATSGKLQIKSDGNWKTIGDIDLSLPTKRSYEIKCFGEKTSQVRIYLPRDSDAILRVLTVFEIEVYEAYKIPSITFIQPNPDIPQLWAPMPFLGIAIPWIDLQQFGIKHSIMVNCPFIAEIKDDTYIKHYYIKRDGNIISEKSFSIEDKKSAIGIRQAVSEGKHKYTIIVENFADKSAETEIILYGTSNGNACVISAPVGPDSGKIRNIYTYSVEAIDVENDPIEYGWDWNGDGSVDQWTSSNTASHSWSKPGEYKIIVSVKEANSGRLGLWTTSKIVNVKDKEDDPSPNLDASKSSVVINPVVPISPITTPTISTSASSTIAFNTKTTISSMSTSTTPSSH